MPQKRGSNAAKAKNTGARKDAPTRQTFEHGSVQADIVGVLLSALAIAMLVSLVTPTSAVVTSAVATALTSLFGIGAVLVPVSLFLFALTFFLAGEEPFGSRVAGGLVLVTLSILSLISLFVPGAAQDPSVVLDPQMVGRAGGYVGGGVAWMLLSLVGLPVGCVVLAAIAITGIVVCGFSMSSFVARVRAGAIRFRETHVQPPLEAFATSAGIITGDVWDDADDGSHMSSQAATASPTSFIGSRKTTVLTRRRGRSGSLNRPSASNRPVSDPIPGFDEETSNPPTLKRNATTAKKPARTASRTARRPEGPGTAATKASASNGENIPDFSRNARSTTLDERNTVARTSRRRPQRSAQGASASSGSAASTKRPKTAKKQQPTRTERKAPVTPVPSHVAVQTTRPGEGFEGYELPPLSMLSSNPNSSGTASSAEELQETMSRLQGTLHEFGLTSRVVDYVAGPIVTTFRVEMGEGERVSRIRNLEDDIALTLAAEKVRIFAPIPGTSYVGIEIPNHARQNVYLGDVLPTATGGPLEVAIGRDSGGRAVVADIAKMPHMLVAGTTGSGKSVMINSMIMSLLMRTNPKQVRLIMIDPKRVEFSCYNGLPHLYVPVVTEPRQAASALQWAVSEMERRLRVFERAGAREIKVYNEMCVSGKLSEMEHPPEPMPYLVVIIDELSDLMMVAGKDVEASIVRIAQLARAAGIHLVIATQRPSANVVTGLIKSNIDNRVALKVSSGLDSRVILDEAGAERLLGNGDMLFKYRGLNMRRVLGCYTSDEEINEVVDFIREQAEPDYHEEILTAVVPSAPAGASRGSEDDADDPLVWEAAQIVVESGMGSTSGLQRRLKVGYARAGRIMDMLEAKGVVGPPDGSKPREVLLDEDGLEELKTLDAQYREVM